nr:hypothetical protein [Roseovarius aestuariivivens]
MSAIHTAQYARALLNAHGGKAEAEAAARARRCKEAGRTAEARDWTKIRAAIRAKRGPLQS